MPASFTETAGLGVAGALADTPPHPHLLSFLFPHLHSMTSNSLLLWMREHFMCTEFFLFNSFIEREFTCHKTRGTQCLHQWF